MSIIKYTIVMHICQGYNIQGIVHFWLKLGRRMLYPLSNLVRRTKDKMKDSVLLNLGVMGMPLGIVLAIEALNHKDSSGWAIMGVWGIVISIFGAALIYALFRDAKKKDMEKEIKQKVRDKILVEILSQLAGLRQDLKGGESRDDRKDNPAGTK